MHDVHVLVIQDGAMQSMGGKSGKEAMSLTCQECQKCFTRPWLLKNHQRVHTGERPYKCGFCEKAFADKSNLRQHQKIHTTTEKLFQCGICCRTFAQRRYLMKHKTEIHRDMSGFCETSEIETESKVKEYIKLPTPSVQKEKPYTCTAVPVESSTQTAAQNVAELPDRSADHQYMTRKKTRQKPEVDPVPPPNKGAEEQKEKQYSEQDLKDFIKSNQKTMEKNGYIFIKQNFESLDTEPKLTEISEVSVKEVKDELEIKADGDTGNQILNINGKMVYLQMGAQPNMLTEKPQSSLESQTSSSSADPPKVTTVSNLLKGRKLIAKKDTGNRRHSAVLKSGLNKRSGENIPAPSGNVKFYTVPNIKQACIRPVHVIPSIQQSGLPGQQNRLPIVPLGVMPLAANQGPLVIPVSFVRVSQHSQPIFVSPAISSNQMTVGLPNISPISISNVNITSPVKMSSVSPVFLSQESLKVIEIPSGAIAPEIDEKGAAGEFTETHIVSSTPIVSDANWQGIVNINSEQELLEFINSQHVTSADSDQSMTILIQNVESQNSSVMSLESQSLLTGSGNFSSVFTDQSSLISDHSAIISEMLPVSDHVNEVHVKTEEDDNIINVKGEVTQHVLEENCHRMLIQTDTEHQDVQESHEAFTGNNGHLEIEITQQEHDMYESNEGKYEIDEQVDNLMEIPEENYEHNVNEHINQENMETFRAKVEFSDQAENTNSTEQITNEGQTIDGAGISESRCEHEKNETSVCESETGILTYEKQEFELADPESLEPENL